MDGPPLPIVSFGAVFCRFLAPAPLKSIRFQVPGTVTNVILKFPGFVTAAALENNLS
jgi:hypothetical protein